MVRIRVLKYLNNLSDEQVEYPTARSHELPALLPIGRQRHHPRPEHHLALPAVPGRRRLDSAVPGSGRAAAAPRVHGAQRTNHRRNPGVRVHPVLHQGAERATCTGQDPRRLERGQAPAKGPARHHAPSRATATTCERGQAPAKGPARHPYQETRQTLPRLQVQHQRGRAAQIHPQNCHRHCQRA